MSKNIEKHLGLPSSFGFAGHRLIRSGQEGSIDNWPFSPWVIESEDGVIFLARCVRFGSVPVYVRSHPQSMSDLCVEFVVCVDSLVFVMVFDSAVWEYFTWEDRMPKNWIILIRKCYIYIFFNLKSLKIVYIFVRWCNIYIGRWL